MSRTVIVGAGVAGVQAALELRQRGYAGEIILIGEESEEPYDRPPLSKEYLKGTAERDRLGLLTAHVAADRAITLRLGMRVDAVRPQEKQVILADGSTQSYEHLLLATGAQNRPLPVPGADAAGVWSLRRLPEADGIRRGLEKSEHVAIVGGGFIGLEVAAAAHAHGAQVTVVEFLPRVMARALSPEMAQYFTDEHRRRGVNILTGVGVTGIVTAPDGAAVALELSDGSEIPADLVVVGIGVLPATELAEGAGLQTADGILVDGQLRTSDPDIYAVGDCVRFDCLVSGRELRLESVQNAADQARFVAARIAAVSTDGEQDPRTTDTEKPSYAALPWFWSEQFDLKLQIAGAAPAEADSVLRGDPSTGSFSVCRFVGERLVAVESVNHARDHLGARKLLHAEPGRRRRVTRDAVTDTSTPLKALLDD
jgi:3-phenylpropionate/trans-cinnamate dioxygenase ferredoxin reductase subunit